MRPRHFAGKLCVYCAESVCESADHVFAREFFPEDDRGSTPKVPACKRCNSLKGALERYATCVLPFGSRHPDAPKMMAKQMPRRLQKNLHIRRQLIKGRRRVLVEEANGLLLPSTLFTADSAKIEGLLQYIIQGLVYHHWQLYLRRCETEIEVRTARVEGDGLTRAILDHFRGRGALHVRHDLANGTVRYEGIGVQVPGKPLDSLWRVQLLDSLYFVPGGAAKSFLISTGPREVSTDGAIE